MSAHGHAHDDVHESGEHEADHDLHDEPAPPEEPPTPLWLTLLGIGLFLLGGIAFLLTRPAGKTVEELTAASKPSAEPAASADAHPPEPAP
jgi:hypothetical protein